MKREEQKQARQEKNKGRKSARPKKDPESAQMEKSDSHASGQQPQQQREDKPKRTSHKAKPSGANYGKHASSGGKEAADDPDAPPKLEFTTLSNPSLATNSDFMEVWDSLAPAFVPQNSDAFSPTTPPLAHQASASSEMNTEAQPFVPTPTQTASPDNPEGEHEEEKK